MLDNEFILGVSVALGFISLIVVYTSLRAGSSRQRH